MEITFPYFLVAIVCLVCACSVHPSDNEWYILNREEGCVAIQTEFEEPGPVHAAKTPSELLQALKNRSLPDVQITPFVEHLYTEMAATGRPLPKAAEDFYKPFNSKNAFVIISNRNSMAIAVVSAALCRSIGGFQK